MKTSHAERPIEQNPIVDGWSNIELLESRQSCTEDIIRDMQERISLLTRCVDALLFQANSKKENKNGNI